MAIGSRSLTYDDLERAREATTDRVELIKGELFVTPAPSLGHQDVVGNLYVLLREAIFAPGHGRVYLAPADVRLAADTIVQPDLVVVLADRNRILTPPRIEGVPSLVIEILSPSTTAYDQATKRNLYAEHAVPEYWLVDPEAWSVTVCSDPREGRYQVAVTTTDVLLSPTIHGLKLDLAAIFTSLTDD
jgi:Uma2 family endonuclease